MGVALAAPSGDGGFFSRLLDTSDFPARWTCGSWTEGHGWLHIVSDLGIWGAYMAIPLVLAFFVLRRPDTPFPRIFWLFVAFIATCGIGHLIEASIFWWPAYRLSGLTKAVTAVVSWATVVALIRVTPSALDLPGLAQINDRLQGEVDARREAQAQLAGYARDLQRSNRDLNEFAAVVSHDLKAPLRGIATLTEFIQQDLEGEPGPEVRDHLRMLRERTHRLSEMIDGILAYSTVGRRPTHPTPVDTAELVAQLAETIPHPAGMTIRADGELPTIRVDPTQLRQVLQNLLLNAVQHMGRDDGTVTVSARRDESAWRFAVRDDGVGIPADDRERIFALFQTGSAEREGPRSTGIGLSVVRRIVERAGGSVEVDSTPGEGTEFSFTLPDVVPGREGGESAGARG